MKLSVVIPVYNEAATIAQLIEELKTSSSKWLKTQSVALAHFAWQSGYGAFSVGPADLEALKQYIDRQEEELIHSRRNIGPSSSSMVWILMSVMFGIEQ